jgi:hypothetical protein
MVFRQSLPFHGVLLIRLASPPLAERKQLLTQTFRSQGPRFAKVPSQCSPGMGSAYTLVSQGVVRVSDMVSAFRSRSA